MSIICVFNDEAVRVRCLDRSINEQRDGLNLDYITVDNRSGQFTTAAAALNYGAAQARSRQIAFIHQDVYLHSLPALIAAGQLLEHNPDIALLGAIGVTRNGRLAGRIRDRVVLIGDPAIEPTEVDSLDELLFIANTSDVMADPLLDDRSIAWHAYAVEYGIRLRRQGRRIAAVNIPLTHNSLTANLDRLEAAHQAVAARHPDVLPVQTTCGPIAAARTSRTRGGFGTYRPRDASRLRRPAIARRVRRVMAGDGAFLLADIRRELDTALRLLREPLTVINVESTPGSPGFGSAPVEVVRDNSPLTVQAMNLDDAAEVVASRRPNQALLLTNLDNASLRRLSTRVNRHERIVGYLRETDHWMWIGPPQRAPEGATAFERALAGTVARVDSGVR